MAARQIKLLVETEVKKSIANIEKQVVAQNKIKKSAKSVTASLKNMMKASGVVFAIKKVLDFTKANQDLADVQEASNTKLNSVLKATRGAAGLTSKELQDMASAYQDVTTFGDEVTMVAQAQLLTFKKIGEDIFPRAIKGAGDMSHIFGSLESATMMLGKALNDPVKGLTALSRAGVQYSDTQRDQIKGFVAVGDYASAQTIILEELEGQFGGTAEAMAKKSKGVRIQLANDMGDIQESIGQGWNKITDPGNRKLLAFVRSHKRTITGIFSNLPEVAKLTFNTVKNIIQKFLSWEGVKKGFQAQGKTIFNILKIAIESMPKMFMSSIKLSTAPIKNFSLWIGSNFMNLWGNVKNSFIDTLQDIPILGETLFGGMEKSVIKAPMSFGEAWDNTVKDMKNSSAAITAETIEAFKNAGEAYGDYAKDLFGEDLEKYKQGIEDIIVAAEKAKDAKDLLDSTATEEEPESNELSFAEGIQKKILALEEERAEAKSKLLEIQELINVAESEGAGDTSARMSVLKKEEKALKDILDLKDEELDKAGELEKRFKKNWKAYNSNGYKKGIESVIKLTDKVVAKVKEFSGVIDSVKSAYQAWQSYSENAFEAEISAIENRLDVLKSGNEALLEENDDFHQMQLDALKENYDAGLMSYEVYISKKKGYDAEKLANDRLVTEEAKKLEEEITAKRKEEAIKQFNIQKATDLISAGIAGALAITQALALGPIAGPIAAGIIGAATATQIAFIASQQPPEYMVGTDYIPEDHLAMVHKGEIIIPPSFSDGLRSGKLSLSSNGEGSSGRTIVYNANFYGDIYDGDTTLERFYEGIQDLQNKEVIPGWQHIA